MIDPPDPGRLADLDAGLLGPDEAAELLADPRSAPVLAALAATRADLRALPAPPVPDAARQRWTAAVADLTRTEPPGPARPGGARDRPPPPTRPPTRAPGRPPFRARRRRLAAAAAAALVVATFVLWPRGGPVEVTRVELVAFATASVGVNDLGPLDDPARRSRCLATVGATGAVAPVLGGRQVRLDGVAGILVLLPGEVLGRYRLVVVTPDCGDGARGTLLAEEVVGR